jgi:hypothetical protein
MTRISTILGSTLVLATANVFAQTNGDTTLSVTDKFQIGEALHFEGKFGPIRLGRASMLVVGIDTVRGVETAHFQFVLNANAMGLIRMDNQFDSWVGNHDFQSRRFVQDFNEFGKHRETAYEIYPDSGTYTSLESDTALVASDNPLDDTAFFYFVRTLDLEPGTRHEFNNYFRPDRNPVVIEVLERESIRVPAGEFETVVIHPIIKGGGIFKESADARMWITDDDRRLIVQMRTKFGFGAVTLRLIDWSPTTAESEASR